MNGIAVGYNGVDIVCGHHPNGYLTRPIYTYIFDPFNDYCLGTIMGHSNWVPRLLKKI